MKICIYESEHFEVAHPVIRLFDIPSHELFVFTNPATHQQLIDLFGQSPAHYHWLVAPRRGSRLRYFWRIYRQVKKIRPDLLYLCTISSNHLLFALVIRLLPATRVVMTIHDINCLYQSRPSWQLRSMLQHIGKRLLIRWVKELNVISDTMVPRLQQVTKGARVIHQVPGSVFDQQHRPVPTTPFIHLVVPGTIDRKRRDYTQVWDLLQEAETRQFPLSITLLGGSIDDYGKSVLQEAADFPTYYTRLRVYNQSFVDQHEFDLRMKEAHFVFIPSVIHTSICGSIPEEYGITKSSGNIFDVVKYAKPFFVPANLRIPGDLQTSAIGYQQVTEIVSRLEQLRERWDQYDALLQQALLNSQEYTLEKVRARNPTLFAAAAGAASTSRS